MTCIIFSKGHMNKEKLGTAAEFIDLSCCLYNSYLGTADGLDLRNPCLS